MNTYICNITELFLYIHKFDINVRNSNDFPRNFPENVRNLSV